MKISDQIPPIYEECAKRFGVKWGQGIIMTYGDTVYCKFPISKDLEVHEATHIEQQAKIGKEIWWKKYFDEPEFRLSQEKEAYLNQAKWIKKNIKDRELKFKLLNKIATDFSSSIYGNIITKQEVLDLIR